jgi:APA family basic amino acid/polyamine antiporter
MPGDVPARTGAAPTTVAGRARLLRLLGVGFGVAVAVGGTIGVGILRAPGGVLAQAGSPVAALTLWLAGGLYSLLGAFALAELSTMTPDAGGYFAYARRAFGPRSALVVGWGDFLVYCTTLAYLSIAAAEMGAALVPSLISITKAVAIVILIAVMALQWRGLRTSSRVQEVVAAFKAIGFVGLAAVCLGYGVANGVTHDVPTTGRLSLAGLILAFQLLLGTYGGWYSAIYFAEEDTDPGRHLPKSLIGGVLLVTLIYVLVNASLLAVLPASQMAASGFPAGDAATLLFGARGSALITILSIVSLVGIIHPVMMMGTRVLFAIARDRGAASALIAVTARGTPALALAFVTVLACALVLTGTFDRLFRMVAVFITGNYAAAMAALFVLRWKEPDAARPFRAWGYPWSVGLVLLVSIGFLAAVIVGDPLNSLAALLLLAASLAIAALALRK